MDLDYHATLTTPLIDRLEEAARAVGLPLREVELLGQDADVAEAFVASVEEGSHAVFLDELDWARLKGRLHDAAARRSRASFVSGPEPSPA